MMLGRGLGSGLLLGHLPSVYLSLDSILPTLGKNNSHEWWLYPLLLQTHMLAFLLLTASSL